MSGDSGRERDLEGNHERAHPDADAASPQRPPAGRRGVAAAALGAAMIGLEQMVFGRKPKDEAAVVVDADGQPDDIDRDGIKMYADDGSTWWSPPQPRSEPGTRRHRPLRSRRNR